jgi:hypothetical protein
MENVYEAVGDLFKLIFQHFPEKTEQFNWEPQRIEELEI